MTVGAQWGEIEAFNRGDPLDGTTRKGTALDDAIAKKHARRRAQQLELLKVGDTTYRMPADVLRVRALAT